MHYPSATLMALLAAFSAVPGQTPTAPFTTPSLRTEPNLPALESLTAAAAIGPSVDAPLYAFAAACLGRLRLGDAVGSRRVLATGRERLAAAKHDGGAIGWLVAAHLWHRRATGAAAGSAAGLADLIAALELAAAAPPALDFASEAMLVHGMFCLGSLLDTAAATVAGAKQPLVEAPPGARWTARAIDRQIELERRTWQPGRGHFRPRLIDGEVALPQPAEPSLLLPAAAGLLIATGDRLDRHLRTVLEAPLAAPACSLDGWSLPLLRLVASSQLGLDAAQAAAWSPALADRTAAPGFAFDALLFAVTGVRIASGAGLDEQWLRCRPWLPPDVQRLEVTPIVAGGCRFALQLHADGDRAAFVITRLDRDEAPCTLVVDDGDRQHVQILYGGDTFAGTSARSHAEPQHELPLRGRSRRGS